MANARMLDDAREYLQAEDLPGWLIYDYLGCNPVLAQVAQPSGHVTRPVFLFVPQAGPPRLLTHHVDAGKFADSGAGTDLEQVVYSSRVTLESALRDTLFGCGRVAMEYSPRNGLPRVSRVDAGTVELVQSMGADVVSSADLMQYATQRWSPDQLAGHKRTAEKLGRIVNAAFARIGQRLADGPTEFEIAEFIRARFREEGLVTADGPIVSANAHCSDPHYEPAPEGSSVIAPGGWILIDLWAREDTPGSVYADITWTAYVGDSPTERHRQIFDIVLGARDAALSFLQESFSRGDVIQGWQADDVARSYISDHGFGDYFTHRLGHSIYHTVHGEGVNLDNFETHDTRRIIPGIGFSIEPGIYLPEFGVRSEIDAYMSEDGPYASSPVQRDIVLITAP
ncbi:MAG: M24 family metallopeptidase [Chloroflexota bacterium]|nr:M24 family metallopeptidase [Chloroflexota bacterium]MDE2959715.1 M24 family metallopeptidase [Chloroflexota bacterium]